MNHHQKACVFKHRGTWYLWLPHDATTAKRSIPCDSWHDAWFKAWGWTEHLRRR